MNKYEISKWTLRKDQMMSTFIKIGGVSVILVVLLILVFITWEVVPLLSKAKVNEINEGIDIPAVEYKALAVDEWSTLPALVSSDALYFVDLQNDNKIIREVYKKDQGCYINSSCYVQVNQLICLGDDQGKFSIVKLNYQKEFLDKYENGRQLSRTFYKLDQLPYFKLSADGGKVIDIAYGKMDDAQLVAGLIEKEGKRELVYVTLKQEVDLFGGEGELAVEERVNLTREFADKFEGNITKLLVSNQADTILAATDSGAVLSFRKQGGKISFSQKFKPFEDGAKIASMNYVFGNNTLIMTNEAGRTLGYTLYKPSKELPLLFGLTKTDFTDLEAGADFYASSQINKSFLTGKDKNISLRYATTQKDNWTSTLDYNVKHAIISKKYDRILLADDKNKLHVLELNDPHPEASWQTYFTKVWYEGENEPAHKWESTGGTEEAEKKLSMMPLIFGTLK